MPTAQQDLITPVKYVHEEPVANPGADLTPVLTWSVASDDDSASGFILVAEDGGDTGGVIAHADVLAMVAAGYGGFQRLTVGSSTSRVLHAISTPLLIVRPHDQWTAGTQSWTTQPRRTRMTQSRHRQEESLHVHAEVAESAPFRYP